MNIAGMQVSWDIVIAILSALLTSAAVLKIGASNGRRLGRWLARRIPGDAAEKWLADFLHGVEEGLLEGAKKDASKAAAAGRVSAVRDRLR